MSATQTGCCVTSVDAHFTELHIKGATKSHDVITVPAILTVLTSIFVYSSGIQALRICEGVENKVGFSRNTYEIK